MATREAELFVEKIEVNLDGRKIFCLFCGGAVIASLVFVLGVTVGRRVEAREQGHTASSAAATDPLAALDGVAADHGADAADLTFASTLRGESEGDPLGPVDRSLDRPPPRPQARPAAALPAAPPSRPPTQPEARPQPAAQPAELDIEPDGDAKAAPAPAPAALPANEAAEPAEPADVSPDGARFTLHLLSFQDRGEADQLVAKLKQGGYQPYVVEGADDSKGTVYRVRVGHFADFEAAVAGKTDFEKKQQIIAYVTRTRR